MPAGHHRTAVALLGCRGPGEVGGLRVRWGWLALLACLLLLQAGCRNRDYGKGGLPAGPKPPGLDYVVETGDTLSTIAAAYGLTVRSIIDANELATAQLTTGQVLRLPGVSAPVRPPEPVMPDWYIQRSAWAVQAIRKPLLDPMKVKPYRITVHHASKIAVSGGLSERGDPVQVMRFIEEIHVQKNGWACIGYHFLVAPDGRVFEGRPIAWQGAHARGDNNIGNIGICLLGDFDRYRPTPQQVQALVGLLDRLRNDYGIAASPRTVLCHKDFVPTECPGTYLEPLVRSYAEGRLSR